MFLDAEGGDDDGGDGEDGQGEGRGKGMGPGILKRSGERTRIRIPTAHILGAKDEAVWASKRLVGLCEEKLRFVLDTGKGHEIPLGDEKINEQMVEVVEEAVGKALTLQ